MVATAARACTWYIRQVDLFRHLADREADSLASSMSPRHFSSGQLIVDRHTRPELVCVMRTGPARLFHREVSGREITVERLGTDSCSASPAWTTTLRVDFVEAETDVDACAVDGRRFLYLMARWPQALLDLATRLGVRVREADEVMSRMTSTRSGAAGRSPDRLARTGSDVHPGGGLRLRGVPRDFGPRTGNRHHARDRHAHAGATQQDGYIRRFGRQIIVPDPEPVFSPTTSTCRCLLPSSSERSVRTAGDAPTRESARTPAWLDITRCRRGPDESRSAGRRLPRSCLATPSESA